jgi:hypothetical protein
MKQLSEARVELQSSNRKYLSTDLVHDEPARDGDRTDRVEFRTVRVWPRIGLQASSG